MNVDAMASSKTTGSERPGDHSAQLIVSAAVVAFAAGWLALDAPSIPCLWKTIFGVDCPGCGLTRAAVFMLHGQFEQAAQMNPLIFPLTLAAIQKFVSAIR